MFYKEIRKKNKAFLTYQLAHKVVSITANSFKRPRLETNAIVVTMVHYTTLET